MDDETKALVRAAGLGRAMAGFPDDVAAAIEMARRHRAQLSAPADPRAEPWPPMRIPQAS